MYGATFAQAAQVPRHLPRRLRKPRKFRGICRDVCASRASLAAFAAAFAQAAQVSWHLPWRLRKPRWVSRHLPWRLRKPRKSLGVCRGVCASCAGSLGVCRGVCRIRATQGFALGYGPPALQAAPASIHSGPGARLVGRMQYAPTPVRSFAPMGRVPGQFRRGVRDACQVCRVPGLTSLPRQRPF